MGKIKELFADRLCRKPACFLVKNAVAEFFRLYLAYCYGELGREGEARAEGAEILRISPDFSLEGWKKRFPHKDPAVVERSLAALRKAGLK